MLKRLAFIGILTGAGHLLSIFAIKYISANSSADDISVLAQADSLFQFLITLIAFGLQSAAMRNIASTENWKQEYAITQSARFTFSLLLLLVAITSIFWQPNNIIFLVAPLLALSGDYALYATGKPITGALIALIRIIILYGLIVMGAAIGLSGFLYLFLAAVAITYVLTNIFISRSLKTPLFFKPSFINLKLFVQNIPLGIVSVSLYFIGFGLLIIIPYFYNNSEMIAVMFVGLKFYLIFKGVLRIIHQAFIREMMNERVCLQVDQLSMIPAIFFLGSVLIFPRSFIILFFGEQYFQYNVFFVFIGIAAFIYSVFLSLATKTMLEKKDLPLTFVTVLAASVTIVSSIIAGFVWQVPQSVAVSICMGELVWVIGLLIINKAWAGVFQRLLFAVQNSFLLIIPLFFLITFGDKAVVYVTAFVISALLILIWYYKYFKTAFK